MGNVNVFYSTWFIRCIARMFGMVWILFIVLFGYVMSEQVFLYLFEMEERALGFIVMLIVTTLCYVL